MQDRLHILEDLNMLYIRQMALSLEVMHHPTPPPSAPPMHASHPVSALLIPAGPEGGGQAYSKWGEGQVVL